MVEGMVVAVPNGVKADDALAAAAAAAKADSPKSVLEDEVIIWPSRFVCSVCRSFPKFFFYLLGCL
jgi:ABC-type phosphate/phosphonate transport system permease subunit